MFFYHSNRTINICELGLDQGQVVLIASPRFSSLNLASNHGSYRTFTYYYCHCS